MTGVKNEQRDVFQPCISLNAAINHLRSQGRNTLYLNRLRCTLTRLPLLGLPVDWRS